MRTNMCVPLAKTVMIDILYIPCYNSFEIIEVSLRYSDALFYVHVHVGL